MKSLAAIALLVLFLPGCAVVGIGLAGVAADNIAQGENSYTNQALDYTCERTSGASRTDDGSCPAD